MNNDQLITETLLQTIHDDIYIKMLGIEFITLSTGYAKSKIIKQNNSNE